MYAKHYEFIKEQVELLKANNDIDPELYDKYNVKLGLRNKNGTGVCVGLTHVADVHGYDIDEEGNKISVPGKLYYRKCRQYGCRHRAQSSRSASSASFGCRRCRTSVR